MISANTYVEFLDHCPDIVELAVDLPCETLFVRSREEPVELYPAEEVAARSPFPVSIEILDAGGHYYVGHESEVAETVAGWLAAIV